MKNKHKFKSGDTLFILDHLNTAVFRTSLDNPGKFIDVNPAFLTIFGYKSYAELKNISVTDLYEIPGEREYIQDELNQVGSLQNKKIKLKRKNGVSFCARISSVLVKDEQGLPLYIDGVVDDLTESEQQMELLSHAESELSERQLELNEERKVFFQGPVVQIQWPLGEQEPLRYISDNVFSILGYTPADFMSGKILYPDLVHDEDLHELQEHIREILNEGVDTISVQPYRLRKKDGDYIWVQDYGYIQKNAEGEPQSILGYIYDVTEIEETHQRIVESEIRYRGLVENSPTGIIRIDCQGNILDVNPRMVEILGSPSAEKTKMFNMFDFPPLRAANISQKFEDALANDHSVQFTSEYTSNWKKTVYFQVVISPVHDGQGRVIGAQGNLEDITLQHQAESSKREIEQVQIEERNMFMAGPIMVLKWNISAEEPLLSVSENVENILGYTKEDLVDGKILFSEIIHPEDINQVREAANRAIDERLESFDTTAYRIRKKDGEYLWVNDHSTINRDKFGNTKSISGIVYDISSMIKAREKLKEKEQNYQTLFNSITEAIFIQDPDTYNILDVNETMLSMYGYSREEVIGTAIQKYSYEQDIQPRLSKIIEEAKTGEQQTFEWHALKQNGDDFWVEVKLYLSEIGGEPRILANVRDISTRKNILVKLKQSLKEQELLLREVHHRVKNNMQVIVSLLNLQAVYTKNDELSEVFRETQNRIRTMALIHDKLFRSSSMSSVDFADYINTVVVELNNFYTIDSRKIQIHKQLDNLDLDITKAIPCGLIINELVTNALKYAFPDNRDGDIWLSVKTVGNQVAEVSVKDNGVGIDSDINISTTKTMGLRIVRILTEQLSGEISTDNRDGTKFILKFNLIDED